MVNKIIAILLALLVIVGMVSCAADKKEPADGEGEEEQSDPAADPAAMDLTDEQIAEKVDYFVTALCSPNVIMLVEAVNPAALTYMTQAEGKSEEDLHAAIEQADTRIRDAWASTVEGLDYTSLVREHSYRQLTDAELQELNTTHYAEIPLVVDCAVSIDVTLSYEDAQVRNFTAVLVKIDGQWWLDPFTSVM